MRWMLTLAVAVLGFTLAHGDEPLPTPRTRSSARELEDLKRQLQTIILRQTEITTALKTPCQRFDHRHFTPVFEVLDPIKLNKGEKLRVTQKINWLVYEQDDLAIALEVESGSELETNPVKMTILNSDRVNSFSYEILAGQKSGTFTVIVAPAVGKWVLVRVTVR